MPTIKQLLDSLEGILFFIFILFMYIFQVAIVECIFISTGLCPNFVMNRESLLFRTNMNVLLQ